MIVDGQVQAHDRRRSASIIGAAFVASSRRLTTLAPGASLEGATMTTRRTAA